MSAVSLIDRISAGEEAAWREFIDAYEGRLRAYFRPRLRDQATADDLTQETLIGFLTSLPNFDRSQRPEPLLFAIAANKLTDHLRKSGRRPALPLLFDDDGDGDGGGEPAGRSRVASSLARSRERRDTEESVLAATLGELITEWRAAGAWDRLACVELTLAAGWSNTDAATRLRVPEQTVANHKSYALRLIRERAAKRGVTAPE